MHAQHIRRMLVEIRIFLDISCSLQTLIATFKGELMWPLQEHSSNGTDYKAELNLPISVAVFSIGNLIFFLSIPIFC